MEYQIAEAQQVSILDDWESYLRVHTSSLNSKSREIPRNLIVSERNEWKLEWQDLVDAREAEKSRLPKENASHYPRAQAKLLELDGQLNDLQTLIERGELYWYDSLRLRSSIEQLVSQIDAARTNIRYYERIRAYGIKSMLEEDLKLMQQAYDQRWNDLRRAERNSGSRLSEAKELSSHIFDELDEMKQLRELDSQDAYENDLSRRMLEFNLPEELRKLATGDDESAAPGQPGVV